MLYDREIDNEVLIQFIILYTLANVDYPTEYNNLLNIVLENCNINFNDFQIALDNLVETDHVNTFLKDEKCRIYEITEKGNNLAEGLRDNVPVYIREPILESIKQVYLEERRKHAVQGEIIPLRDDAFAAELKLFDDDKVQLMGLELFAGSRETAQKMADYFKNNYEEVYGKIMEIMNESQK